MPQRPITASSPTYAAGWVDTGPTVHFRCRAQVNGVTRQQLELLNPVNEKEMNFMATEAMDYPCRWGAHAYSP